MTKSGILSLTAYNMGNKEWNLSITFNNAGVSHFYSLKGTKLNAIKDRLESIGHSLTKKEISALLNN